MPEHREPLPDFFGNGMPAGPQLSGNSVKEKAQQVPVVGLDRPLVGPGKTEQRPDKQRKHVEGGGAYFQVFFVLGGKGELFGGLLFQLVHQRLDFGNKCGGEPAHLGGVSLDPENLRVNAALAHQVECREERKVQVTHRVVVPRKVPRRNAAQGSHETRHRKPRLDDGPVFLLLETPVPGRLVEKLQVFPFHQEGLEVVGPEMFREGLEIFVARKKIRAGGELVGVALAEIAGRAKVREVRQHGGQYAGIVLQTLEIEIREPRVWLQGAHALEDLHQGRFIRHA